MFLAYYLEYKKMIIQIILSLTLDIYYGVSYTMDKGIPKIISTIPAKEQ